MEIVTPMLDSSVQKVTLHPFSLSTNQTPSGVSPDRADMVNRDIGLFYNQSFSRNLNDLDFAAMTWMGKDGWSMIHPAYAQVFKLFIWADGSLGKFASVANNTIIAYRLYGDDKIEFKVQLYSATNRYSINGYVNPETNANYMGGYSESRAARPGEDWTRGNDLSDGDFDYFTWTSIMADILSCELLNVQQKNTTWGLKPDDGPCEATEGYRRCLMRHVDHGNTGETRPFKA